MPGHADRASAQPWFNVRDAKRGLNAIIVHFVQHVGSHNWPIKVMFAVPVHELLCRALPADETDVKKQFRTRI